MAYATIDESNLPIVLITFSEVEPTHETFNAYLDAMYNIYARRQPVSFVFDATRVKLGEIVRTNKQKICITKIIF
jgi:hypothetical protein